VFAAEGLRTLVLAHRQLGAQEAKEWCALWKAATEATQDREGALEKAAARLEKDLVVNTCAVTVADDEAPAHSPGSLVLFLPLT
jgi:phospholipid-translocating ATPase